MFLRQKGLIVIVAVFFSFGMGGLAAAQQGAVTGGAKAVALPCGEPGPWHVAMDSENIYWTDFAGGKVLKAPVGGGQATVLASGQAGPCGLTVDQLAIYWTNNSDGTVMRLSKQGGKAVAIASGQDHPAAIGVSDITVYCSTSIDTVKKLDLGGLPEDKSAVAASLNRSNSPAVSFAQDISGHTVHCDLCTTYCTKTVCDPKCHNVTYACGLHSCNCR